MRPPERADLLHNMSAPPKTVVRYAGLARLDHEAEAAPADGRQPHGVGVRFALPPAFDTATPATILAALGVPPAADPAARLAGLIERRAAELPLPDGCVVVGGDGAAARMPWPDPLAALAVLCKAGQHVWLRAKEPAVHGPFSRRRITLLVPPDFATALENPLP